MTQRTRGLTGQPTSVNLPTGLSVSVEYTLTSNVTSAFQEAIPGFPSGSAVQTMASLSTSGFTVDIGMNLGTGTGGLAVFDSHGSAFFLDGFDVKLLVGSQNQVTLSGNGTLALSPWRQIRARARARARGRSASAGRSTSTASR